MTGLIIFLIVVFIIALLLGKGKDEAVVSSAEEEDITPEERGARYELKRKNFQLNAEKYFSFLVDEFGYNRAEHKFSQQDNGTIIRDDLRYLNPLLDRLIVVTNAYHPYDYGFEICMYRPSISIAYSDDHNVRFLAIDFSKENQDLEQSYLEKVANDFRDRFLPQIKGEAWIEESDDIPAPG